MGRDGRPLPWASAACWPGLGGQRGHAGTWVGGSRAPAPPAGDLSQGPLPGWPHCPSLEWRHCWRPPTQGGPVRRLGGARPTWGSGAAGASGRPGGRRGGSRRSRGAPRRPCTPHTHPRSSGAGERHAASGRPGMGQRPPRETPLAGSLLKSRPDCLLPRAPQGPPTSETLAPNTCWPIPLGKNGP